MAVANATFLNDFSKFCAESTSWCAKASEAETTRINDIVVTLMNDLKRRSAVSDDALKVLASAKTEITQFLQRKNVPLKDIVTTLKRLSSESGEISDLLNPIVEALQFQDRLRQNLENIAKAISSWTKAREARSSSQEFGADLLKCMTSPEERKIIRDVIPGLPEEQVTTDSALLF